MIGEIIRKDVLLGRFDRQCSKTIHEVVTRDIVYRVYNNVWDKVLSFEVEGVLW